MSDDESTHPELVCWFCRKGRHEDCMKKIPFSSHLDQSVPRDCSFDVETKECVCMDCCNKRTN